MRWAMHPVTPMTRSGFSLRSPWSWATRPRTRCSACSLMAHVFTSTTSGLVGRVHDPVALLRQHALHQLSITDIHLAAVRLHVGALRGCSFRSCRTGPDGGVRPGHTAAVPGAPGSRRVGFTL